MTASNYLYIIAIGLVVVGWETRVCAEGDVTIYTSSPGVTNAPTDGVPAPDGAPVIHKSVHKTSTADGTSVTSAGKNPISFGPTVETGLPVARHTHGDDATTGDAAPVPVSAMLPGATTQHLPPSIGSSNPAASTRMAMVGSIPGIPSVFPQTPASTHVAPKQSTSLLDDFGYSSPSPVHKGPKNIYPWKTNIITTYFWIGEPGSAVSSTANVDSAWVEDWRASNGGSDTPDDRNGILPGSHAARVNPFYVALPFNDLAFPDKAREWLPPGWYKSPKNGKQVSACKDRWVEIKVEDGSGRYCYAQWEDVGPLRYDHAEYVFGSERPDTYTRAGLDVSPAIWQYLHLTGKDRVTTRWRFVDDEDVQPGVWLKYEEQAVIFRALHEAPNSLPIEAARAPIDDSSNVDSNKKKVGAAKG